MLTYSDVIRIPTFEERLEFLQVNGKPSELTFDELRDINQKFYNSRQWKFVRESVIARDLGFDLAVPGREIFGKVLVHHMNPLRPKDLYLYTNLALDPEFLITVSHSTHQAIHFGSQPEEPIVERVSGDTKLW